MTVTPMKCQIPPTCLQVICPLDSPSRAMATGRHRRRRNNGTFQNQCPVWLTLPCSMATSKNRGWRIFGITTGAQVGRFRTRVQAWGRDYLERPVMHKQVQTGFTLIELPVVIAIITILAAMLLSSLARGKTEAQSA